MTLRDGWLGCGASALLLCCRGRCRHLMLCLSLRMTEGSSARWVLLAGTAPQGRPVSGFKLVKLQMRVVQLSSGHNPTERKSDGDMRVGSPLSAWSEFF